MRNDNNTSFTAWASFVDVTMMTILILILINLFQYLLNQDIFKMEIIKNRKDEIWRRIEDGFPEETQQGIITKDDSSPQMLTLRFSDRILFDRGEYKLTIEGIDVIQRLADILKEHPGYFREIKVQGHTDDLPFRNPAVYNNWDLSSDRAKSVVKAILSDLPDAEKQLMQKLLVAAGYSHFHPVTPLPTIILDLSGDPEKKNVIEGNPFNRRIDIELEFVYSEELYEQ